VRGVTLPPGTTYTDTILISADTRVALASYRAGCSHSTVGFHGSLPSHAIFEYFWVAPALPCPQFHTYDTLLVFDGTLLRRTPLVNGVLEEVYERR